MVALFEQEKIRFFNSGLPFPSGLSVLGFAQIFFFKVIIFLTKFKLLQVSILFFEIKLVNYSNFNSLKFKDYSKYSVIFHLIYLRYCDKPLIYFERLDSQFDIIMKCKLYISHR